MAHLFFSTDGTEQKAYSRRVSRGELARISRGLYTDAQPHELEALVRNNWAAIVQHAHPGCLPSYRTAVELYPKEGQLFVSANVKSAFKIAIGQLLTINVLPGDTEILIHKPVIETWASNPVRQLLENLAVSRNSKSIPKSLGQEWVEKQLVKILKRDGDIVLNEVRDQAKNNAKALGLEKEYKRLNKLISALMSTHRMDVLASHVARSQLDGKPNDALRIELFEGLIDYLNRCVLNPAPYNYSKASWTNQSFFESYFSNFIEGTEFEIDEAEEIVFSKETINGRHEDSHDISAIFGQVSDYEGMCTIPQTGQEFINQLKERHFDFMRVRQDKNPGEFKTRRNKAGSTSFVDPSELEGTLIKGFELAHSLPEGLPRAIFMQFLVSECHPFDDGNGRLSRIMMNTELAAAGQHKILVPTVYRDSYLNGLRHASRERRFRTLVKVFANLQQYAATIDWNDYSEARETLEDHQAHLLPDEGTPRFSRELRKLKIDLPSE